MIVRTLALAAGIGGAAALSQFPEFSQQYVQRLGGAVDELSRVADDFDASAHAEGLSRAQALEQMQGTEFVARRRADMERSFLRLERLQSDLQMLRGHGPFMRAYRVGRLSDRDIVARTWDDFAPAVPLTLAGAIFAALGFVAGWGGLRAIMALIRRITLRRRLGGKPSKDATGA